MDLTFFFSLPWLLSSILFLVTCLKLVRSFRSKKPKLPPGPRRLPIIGSAHHLVGGISQLHRRLRELSEKYGPLTHLQLGEISLVVVSSAEAAKEVVKTKDHIFGQRPWLAGSDIVFYGPSNIVLSRTGDYWKLLRKISSQHLLNATCVRSFQTLREEEVSSLMKRLSAEAGSAVNLTEHIFATACRIASRAAFGEMHGGAQEEAIMWACTTPLSTPPDISDLFPSRKWLQVAIGARRRYEEVRRKIDVVLENIIANHVGETEEGGSECLLSVLLTLERHGDLTMDNVKAVILDVILAAFEPASKLVEWAMAEMVRKPITLKKAQDEVRQILKKKGRIDEVALEELGYLKLVIKETLRLYPAAPLLAPRECTQTCEINGYTIPEKTQVFVNAWAIGRDPKYWTSSSSFDAEEFAPERFINSSIDYKGSNFEYIPFGGGKRVCPGMLFGPAIAEILLANLLCYFDWELPSGTTPETLDMTDLFMASTLRKKDALILVPTPHNNLMCK